MSRNPCHALGGEVNVTMVGAFSRASGFEMSGRFPSTIIRRMNMKKLAIRCGAVVSNIFVLCNFNKVNKKN